MISRIKIPLFLCGLFALAQNAHASDQYFFAEKYFDKLEMSSLMSFSGSQVISKDGFYYRTFNNDSVRYGVSIDQADANYYKYTAKDGWTVLGQRSSLAPTLKGTTLAAINLPNTSSGDLFRLNANVIDPVIGINNDIIVGHLPWSPQDIISIVSAYEAGRSIVLFEPKRNDVIALYRVIGRETNPSEFNKANAYGIYAINNSGDTFSVYLAERIANLGQRSLDTAIGNKWQREVSSVLQWLRKEAVENDNSKQAVQPTSGRFLTIRNTEYKLPSQPSFEEVIDSFDLGNSYETITQAWTFYEASQGRNYIYTEVHGQWNPEPASNRIQGNGRQGGRIQNLTESYNIITNPTKSQGVRVGKSSPETSNGSSSSTSGIDVSISGDVSTQGVGIGGGVSFSTSFTYNAQDVEVRNLGKKANRPASTGFEYNVRMVTDLSSDGDKIPKLAYSNFQPDMAWLWTAESTARAAQPKGLEVNQSWQSRLYDWSRLDGRVSSRSIVSYNRTFTIPWPKTQK